MKRNVPLTRKTPLRSNPDSNREWQNRSQAQARKTHKPRPLSPASDSQRAKCRDMACLVCRTPAPSDAAHLVSRAQGGNDHPLAVVPLCRRCHALYDSGDGTGKLDLLPYLEPGFRAEIAYAVELVGMAAAYRRITNDRDLRGAA